MKIINIETTRRVTDSCGATIEYDISEIKHKNSYNPVWLSYIICPNCGKPIAVSL